MKNRKKVVILTLVIFGLLQAMEEREGFEVSDETDVQVKIEQDLAKIYGWRREFSIGKESILPCEQLEKNLTRIFQEAQKIFKYNVNICWTNSTNCNVKTDEVMIFSHGFGGDGSGAAWVMPSDASCCQVTFNFADAKGALWKTSLGQEPEAQVLAYVANACKQVGFKKVSLFGLSRGGQAVLTTLRMIADSKYAKELHEVGIKTKQERLDLLDALKNGRIVLQVPLTDSIDAIGNAVSNTSLSSSSWFNFRSSRYATAASVGLCTEHSVWGMQGRDAIKWLCDNKQYFTTVWYMQKNDKIVPNDGIIECVSKLYEHAPDSTYFLVGSGGHNTAADNRFESVIHALGKHLKNKKLNEEEQASLQEAQPDKNESPNDYIIRLCELQSK